MKGLSALVTAVRQVVAGEDVPRVLESTVSTAQDFAVDIHMTAPRGGGATLNAFGQLRSSPGEQPAVEWGGLLDAMMVHPPVEGSREGTRRYQVVNYAPLEEILDRKMVDRVVDAVKGYYG